MAMKQQSQSKGFARVSVYEDGELKRQFFAENIMTKTLHEHVVSMLNPESDDSSRITVTQLAIGDSDASAAAYTDTSLNNEIERFDIADYDSQENDAFISTFISGPELVGEDIKECGLYTDATGGDLLNHFIFDTADQILDKTASETLVVDILLQWRAA